MPFTPKDAMRAQSVLQKLSTLVPIMFRQSNPIPVKTALAEQGRLKESFRLPLCTLSQDERTTLVSDLALDWLGKSLYEQQGIVVTGIKGRMGKLIAQEAAKATYHTRWGHCSR